MNMLRAKWLKIFVGACVFVTMAAFVGAFGNRPYVAVIAISQAVHSVAVFLFLYLMVRSRGTTPFWPALGWRAFSAAAPPPVLASLYMFAGAGLAILIQAASNFIGAPSNVPMEEMFRDRPSVLLMMALGILVAPLLEETLFRGCAYPVLARTFGIAGGVFLAGALFGISHAPQLGWAWKQVALLCGVGMIFTYIRARAGTVLASYFVHLGYNILLFAGFYFATNGLRNFPGP